jgi:hypothetical protein
VRDVWGSVTKKLQKGIRDELTFLHVVEEMLGRCDLA